MPTVDEVVAAWNGPANDGVRAATRPPRGPAGPFPLIGAGRGVMATPEGGYEVRVGVSPGRGAIGRPTSHSRFIVFRYFRGYAGDPATVIVPLDPRTGAFELGRATMYFGANTDHSVAPLATHHDDGHLTLD
jgi:hypothetical protein